MRCESCGWKYPRHLLSLVHRTIMCSICRLERMNRILRTNLEGFSDTMEETTRLACIMWREHHPSDGPVTMDEK